MSEALLAHGEIVPRRGTTSQAAAAFADVANGAPYCSNPSSRARSRRVERALQVHEVHMLAVHRADARLDR